MRLEPAHRRTSAVRPVFDRLAWPAFRRSAWPVYRRIDLPPAYASICARSHGLCDSTNGYDLTRRSSVHSDTRPHAQRSAVYLGSRSIRPARLRSQSVRSDTSLVPAWSPSPERTRKYALTGSVKVRRSRHFIAIRLRCGNRLPRRHFAHLDRCGQGPMRAKRPLKALRPPAGAAGGRVVQDRRCAALILGSSSSVRTGSCFRVGSRTATEY
jgi:hypothetical protein